MKKQIKTAVVYDKWLSTLGGGEVVACNIAKALLDENYQVTFISGKLVNPDEIKNKLNVDIKKAKFVEIWNNDREVQEYSSGKDVYVNASFMDYTTGLAKKNFYYTSFPTEPYNSIKTYLLNNFLYPKLVNYIKPIEFINDPTSITFENENTLYGIGSQLKIAFSYLEIGQKYNLKFIIFLENFNKTILNNINWEILNVKTENNQIIKVDHNHNTIKILSNIIPEKKTIYLNIKNNNKEKGVFLIDPRIQNNSLINLVYKPIFNRVNSRMRAGIFSNVAEKMKRFNIVFANSNFTSQWIEKYWKLDSTVLYPPVKLIKNKNKIKKQNIICSVGRFFTHGHGKKQEVMVKAFMQMVDNGLKDWELHLAGGLSKDNESAEFAKSLKKMAKKYPIYFHFNQSRDFIENLYLKSKIYWHAAGFGENPNKKPIKFEHFGITPIEAMSAGCIPVLYNGGGLPDTIYSLDINSNQYLFKDISELLKKTKYIIENYENQFKIIKEIKPKLVQLYDEKVFRDRFIKLI